ncbi:MAG TPA: hydrogenase expression/formation protein HypE [Bacteroidota bacterium]|nr:hydrogenase expression/formation protein HypE [Bacteroidota bacterium]
MNKESADAEVGVSCPVPINEYENVLLAHGAGGKLSHQLVTKMFAPEFGNEYLDVLHDGAILSVGESRLAYSTDSFVVSPLFFPGGDIGSLAVNGTVNDLSMCGATPLYLSAAFIIEEGLSMHDLRRIVLSMQASAKIAGVTVVTGDTKVIERGKGDKIYINTSGIGVISSDVSIDPRNARPGDKIIVSGTIADHGIAIMSVREGLAFETELKSDCAALNRLVSTMLAASSRIHVLRDPTRGGVASALNEIADSSNVGMTIYETDIPLRDEVQSACEILGFDPLYVANEGKLIAIVHEQDAGSILNSMKEHPLGKDAAIIGEVTSNNLKTVLMKSRIGGTRVVDMLSGEQLPRIC